MTRKEDTSEFEGKWILVSNTNIHTQGVPSAVGHWVAFCFSDGVLKYFDPLGWKPHARLYLEQFLQMIERSGIEIRNVAGSVALQSKGSACCGQYCVYFIREFSLRGSEEGICEYLRSKFPDENARDDYVCEYYSRILEQKFRNA
ncbi:hypothetical protein JTE90_027794 [Oedothorax gibbosus]|uniref:Ubiquitin-like protease family profile domain-containing protein n=1 Tax=Oedothorax gibbosus TaxID=931172 RepID=A0AAV6V955_9ARAC|nr:hypothetical protein JTE90_027794 [Oedothorax gibbosus]